MLPHPRPPRESVGFPDPAGWGLRHPRGVLGEPKLPTRQRLWDGGFMVGAGFQRTHWPLGRENESGKGKSRKLAPPSSLSGAPHPLQTLPFKASLHKSCQALLLMHDSILPLIHFINPTALRVKSLSFSLVHEALLEGSHLLPSFPCLSS